MSKEVWDYQDALSRTLSSDDILAEVIRSYIDDTELTFEQLLLALSTHDLANIQFHAHTLKGTALNIGSALFSEHARLLEFAVKESKLDKLEALTKQLSETKHLLLEQLFYFLNNRAKPEN